MIAISPQGAGFFPASFRAARPLVALKVQRRRYATNAVDELELRRRIGSDDPASRFVMDCAEVFMHGQHICQAYELHGRDTKFLLKQGPLPVGDVKILTRHVLQALKLMHSRGLVHADIKPGNVLWCEAKREARLIDFGNAAPVLKTGSAIGTREYCPPEMLFGNPMNSAVDMWALGCTVFEWLTGQPLFDPWEVCHQKYAEFGSDDQDDDSTGEPDEDDLEEAREQLPAGAVLAGKYRLRKEIGRGKCTTVWTAEMLHDEPLRHPMPSPEEAKGIAAPLRKPKPAPTGYNIYEVVMGYEHLLLMQELLGRIPDQIANGGRFQLLFFDADGKFRFDPMIKRNSLKEMAQKHGSEIGTDIEEFLFGLLQFEPKKRMTAGEALCSSWLHGVC